VENINLLLELQADPVLSCNCLPSSCGIQLGEKH